MKAKLIILVLVFGALPLVSKPQKVLSDSIVKLLKTGVEGFKDRYHTPGIAVAVVHDQSIIFSDALGFTDLQNKVPATVNSKFPILSITKMFTATMFMQLRQRGIIRLDDDIAKYVPEYKGTYRQTGHSGTTLLQLATHTSGLPRNSPADVKFARQIDEWLLKDKNMDTIASAPKTDFLRSLQYLKKEYPVYQFLGCGDRHYSNLGYALLGTGLERAARADFKSYIINRICRPMGMINTGFGTSSFGNNVLAKGYYFEEKPQRFKETPVYKPNSIIYAGGIYSTATDLAKFISFQFNDTSGLDASVLSPDNKRMMQNFGIGWKREYPFVVHEGSMLGFHSEIVADPELKIGWVILTNTTDFEFNKMNDYISRLIVPFYSEKPVVDLKKYIGTYVLKGGYGSLKIYLKDGKLYSTYLHETLTEVPLMLTGENRFQGQEKGSYKIEYQFIANAQSEIRALNLDQLMWIKQ